MTRSVSFFLLIAYLCVNNVSSGCDCTAESKNDFMEEPASTPPPRPSSATKQYSDEESYDQELQRLRIENLPGSTPPPLPSSTTKQYSNLKESYNQELQRLQIENGLLKQLYTTATSYQTGIHTIQTYCTCNISDRSATDDCKADSQVNSKMLMEKIQEMQKQLLSINENIKTTKSESKNTECNSRPSWPSDAEFQMGDSVVDWKQLPGAAVEVSAKNNELWVINASQNIYRWNGTDWKLMPGAAVRVGSSPDGWTWVVNSDDKIFRWNVDKNDWDQMPGALVQISAISKDRALGVNRGHGIYLWSNNAWTRLPGAATWAGIGDGDERWVINSAHQIYRWNHQVNDWQRMPGLAVNVDVQNPCRVIVTNASNQMFIWRNNDWYPLNGAGTRSSVNASHYFTVNTAHQIFKGH